MQFLCLFTLIIQIVERLSKKGRGKTPLQQAGQ